MEPSFPTRPGASLAPQTAENQKPPKIPISLILSRLCHLSAALSFRIWGMLSSASVLQSRNPCAWYTGSWQSPGKAHVSREWPFHLFRVPNAQTESGSARQQVTILRGSPWQLWSPPEWAGSKQHARLLTHPWPPHSYSPHGSGFTTSRLPVPTFTASCIAALPPHSSRGCPPLV